MTHSAITIIVLFVGYLFGFVFGVYKGYGWGREDAGLRKVK